MNHVQLKQSIIAAGVSCLLFALSGSAAVAVEDKFSLVETGYITKIDLKNKVLAVHGYVNVFPEEIPGQSMAVPRVSFQSPRPGGRGERGGGSSDPVRDFKVYVSATTAIQKGSTMLAFGELKIEDYVTVVGTPKGKSKSIDVDASSIAVSEH